MALSDDLRERVVEAVVVGGLSRNAAAKRFGVSIASAVRWVQRFNATGEISPAADGRGSPVRPHRGASRLSARSHSPPAGPYAVGDPGAADRQLRRAFLFSVIWRFFDRHEITFKKDRACRGAAAPGRLEAAPGMVWGATRPRSEKTRFHR